MPIPIKITLPHKKKSYANPLKYFAYLQGFRELQYREPVR
jgi:hypothetical protein